jgi:hypothetical protein
MALIIKTSGEEITITPEEDNGELSLQQLQQAVGGYIELVSIMNPDMEGKTMFCNECGKLSGLEPNIKATKLAGLTDDILVGDVIICEKGEVS